MSDYMVLAGGKERPASASSIVLRPGPSAKTTAPVLRARSAQAAAAADVKLLRLRINRPLGWPAPELLVRTSDPRAFVAARAENLFRLLDPVTQADDGSLLSEGAFAKVVDERGRVVAIAGFSVRTGKGFGL
jgi:hypothetical protein